MCSTNVDLPAVDELLILDRPSCFKHLFHAVMKVDFVPWCHGTKYNSLEQHTGIQKGYLFLERTCMFSRRITSYAMKKTSLSFLLFPWHDEITMIATYGMLHPLLKRDVHWRDNRYPLICHAQGIHIVRQKKTAVWARSDLEGKQQPATLVSRLTISTNNAARAENHWKLQFLKWIHCLQVHVRNPMWLGEHDLGSYPRSSKFEETIIHEHEGDGRNGNIVYSNHCKKIRG